MDSACSKVWFQKYLVSFNLINLVKIFVHVIMEKRSKAIEAFVKALNPTTGGSAVYVYLIK